MTTLIIRRSDGFRDIGSVTIENGIVTGTKINSQYRGPDPLHGMKGFIEKSVYDYAKKAGWKVSVDG